VEEIEDIGTRYFGIRTMCDISETNSSAAAPIVRSSRVGAVTRVRAKLQAES
jgi:hypothetical protein